MDNTIIRITNLRKDYFVGEITVHALRGIDMEIKEGEFVAIMGTSGSGKSTMLNILGCLDTPSGGSYHLDSVDVSTMNRDELARLRNLKLGFVFQAYNLLPRTTALENVELPLFYNNRIKAKERRELAMNALESVGLADRLDHMPNQLSGGQKQRLLIARAIISKPKIIYFDEATSALDNKTQKIVSESLANLGVTRVVIAHRLSTIVNCNKIFVMDRGQIVEQGSYQELYEKGGLFTRLVQRQLA